MENVISYEIPHDTKVSLTKLASNICQLGSFKAYTSFIKAQSLLILGGLHRGYTTTQTINIY